MPSTSPTGQTNDRRRTTHDMLHGAIVGLVAGLAIGLVGEMARFVTLELFPTDVAIVGFAVYWGVIGGVAIGALCGWRGWLPNRIRRGLVAAVPGVVASVLAVLMQWAAV